MIQEIGLLLGMKFEIQPFLATTGEISEPRRLLLLLLVLLLLRPSWEGFPI